MTDSRREAKINDTLTGGNLGEAQTAVTRGAEVAMADIGGGRARIDESDSFMDYLRVNPSADADFDIERSGDLPRA